MSTLDHKNTVNIGWGQANITPDEPVQLAGQHYARISEGVLDPVTATALALVSDEDTANAVILISCDLVSIAESLRDAVRERVVAAVPELAPESVILHATHTHTAPTARQESDGQQRVGAVVPTTEIELPAMSPSAYIDWAAGRIAEAVVAAWTARAPGAIGFGLGQAVVGRNRRSAYADGSSRMYGDTADAGFSHIEGYEDHSVNLMGTWDADGLLTGLVVNVACPSQVDEHRFEISADYWHDTRVELRKRFGNNLFVLPQCSTAGDQSPHVQWDKAAEERMLKLAGRTRRQEIALRIADTVGATLPAMEQARQSEVVLLHRTATLDLPRRPLTETDVEDAMAGAEPHRLKYEELLRELEAHPEMREQPRWYHPITYEYRRWRWFANVKLRYENQQAGVGMPVEAHVVRLGDMAIATNPFEYYLDYGIRIKARSPAAQTFLVQLAGAGGYVPSERSVAGKGYGSVPASTPIGPEGGRMLEAWTLRTLQNLWATEVRVDCSASTAPIRAIHGVNKGPLVGNGVNYNDHSAYFKEIGFPTVRLHDIPSDWRQSVDVPCMFPLFHLDPQDPHNYDFRRTDVYIRSIVECGSGVVYRLGVQIEREELNFDVDPPADVDKWIEVCANIIRHYNEGWGNGFHYGIRYWEIWNEPDNGPGQWNGTFEEFTAFYIKVATRLKALFPDLMIGGPALNGGMIHCPRQKLEAFLPHVKAAGAPLDFLSWHAYPGDGVGNAGDQVKAVAGSRDDAGTARSLTGALRVLAGAAREVRQTLDAYGFTATESHLNEWNLAPLQWGFQTPEVAEAYLAEKRGPLGSAVIAATLSVLQDEPVDMTNFYTAARRGYGIFDDFGRPFKPFYAFRAFKKMLKDTPNRCPISGSDLESGHTVLAGISAAGDVVQVLLSNCGGTPWQPRISLRGLTAAPAALSSLVIDADHNLEADPADPTVLDGSDIVTSIPPHTVRLVRLNIWR